LCNIKCTLSLFLGYRGLWGLLPFSPCDVMWWSIENHTHSSAKSQTLYTICVLGSHSSRLMWRWTVKCKGKGLDTCYSATYMSQTRDQQRFTISEVAADWHEPMVPQRIMWPSIVRALTDNWTHGAVSRHTIAPISHTRPSPRSRSYYSFPVSLKVGGWVGLSTQ